MNRTLTAASLGGALADAYPTHGVRAAVLLYLVARGPGTTSLDHLLAWRLHAL